MKRLFCWLICGLFMASLCGCGSRYLISDDPKEKEAYSETIKTFFAALDDHDADTIYALFSPAVRAQDHDLKEQINKLFAIYEGPTDEIGWDGLLGGEGTIEYGDKSKNAFSTFPVRCENTFYWCYLDLMYENSFDEKQIGITELCFYTADEFCILREDDDATIEDTVGLEVYAEKTLDEEIRCIHYYPYKYSSSTRSISIDDVTDFFKTSTSFDAFKARFGAPNAEQDFDHFYELPPQKGEARYLELGVDVDGDAIFSADIVDTYSFIETVFREGE